MLFNQANYAQIRAACESKTDMELEVPRSATAFAESQAPLEWTAYPPCILPPEGYAQVFVHSGADLRGAVTRFELTVHLSGGRILYKAKDHELVSMKVTWPEDA